MKKIIIKITSALCVVTAITSVAVFTTASVSSLPPVRVFDTQSWNDKTDTSGGTGTSLRYAEMPTTDVGIKDLLMGTKSINNGNYVLFVGSEAEQLTDTSLYPSTTTPGLLANNNQLNFDSSNAGSSSSSYSKTINRFYNDPTFQDKNNNEKPQFLMYLDKLNGVVSKEQKDYTTTKEAFNKKHRGDGVAQMPAWNDESYIPGKTYTKDDKTYKFRNDKAAQDYLDIQAFIQTAYGSLGTLQYPFIISFTTASVSSGGSVWKDSIAPADDTGDDTTSSATTRLQDATPTAETNMSTWLQKIYHFGTFQ